MKKYSFSVKEKNSIPDDAEYEWSFGDGSTDKGEQVTHLFAASGKYKLKVKASWKGGSAEADTEIEVAEEMPVEEKPAPQGCPDVDYSKLKKVETEFQEVCYVDSNGLKQGPYIKYWDNARKQTQLTGCYLDGKRTGHWITYSENGYKESEGDYIDDKPTGHWMTTHRNGNKFYEGEYKDGEPTGHWIYYLEDGTVAYEMDY